jgi:ribonuclease-3
MNLPTDFQQLEEILRYSFSNRDYLTEALRHSSFVNEQSEDLRDNERLEFLGDAVLNLVIGHLLMSAYPQMREGELSRIRANMVNETQLADLARGIDLGPHLLLGKGEMQTNGQDKNSLLANALEALIAAVYMDGGYAAAFDLIGHHFGDLIAQAPLISVGQDYKSRLQEAVQSTIKEIPAYQIVEETGPDHDKTFYVLMTVGDLETKGAGKSKKLAEQEAARLALEQLERA